MKTNVKHNLYAVGMFLLIAALTLLVASCSPSGSLSKPVNCPTYSMYTYRCLEDTCTGIIKTYIIYDSGNTFISGKSGHKCMITGKLP